MSRVSGCRETRDLARQQEQNNNYKPSEGLTVIGVRHCSTSFASIYLQELYITVVMETLSKKQVQSEV